MFKKNTAVTGFPFVLINRSNGNDVTSGTVTCYVILNGTYYGSNTNAAYDGSARCWKVNLTAAEMNGDIVGLIFQTTTALTVCFTIKTVTTLGTDNKVLLSADAQTGVTIPTVTSVTNDVGITQVTADRVWSTTARTVTGGTVNSVTGSVGSIGAGGITNTSFAANAIDSGAFSQTAADKVWGTTLRTITGGTITSVTNGVTVATNNDKTGYSLVNGSITSSTFALDAISASAFSQAAADKVWGTTTRQLTGIQVFNLTGNIAGNLSGSIGSISTGGISSTSFAASSITASAFATDAISSGAFSQAAADKIWSTTTRQLTNTQSFNLTGNIIGNLNGIVTTVTSVTNGVTVTTNNDKTGYSLLNGSIVAATFSVDSISSSAFSQAAADKIWNTTSRTLTSYPGIETAVWNSLTSGMITTGSIGKKLADWSLGSDNRVLVSANLHTSGETVAAVTGDVGGDVVGSVASVTGNVGGNVVGSVASVTGNVEGYVGSIKSGGITTNSFSPGSITSNVFASGAITSTVLATNAITSSVLANNCIIASKIAANAISNTTFAANSIDATAFSQTAADKVWATTSRTITAAASDTASQVWSYLTANAITVGSFGKKLADWTLGTDFKSLISSDIHISGVTVAAVTGNIGGNVVGSIGSVVGNVNGSVASVTGSVGSVTSSVSVSSIGSNVITSSVIATDAIGSDQLATSAADEISERVWYRHTDTMTEVNSLGKKLADWSLGSDNRVLLSVNAQTGVVIPTVTHITDKVDLNNNQTTVTVGTVNALGTNANTDVKADVLYGLVNYDVGNGVAKESSLASLKFMSPFNIIAPNQIIIPDVGIQAYKFLIYYYDSEGKSFDPDSNLIGIKATDQGGEDENYLLYQDSGLTTHLVDSTTYIGYCHLIREDVGIYSFYLGIDSTNDDTQIIYDFVLDISASEYHYAYTHAILQGSITSVDLTDNTVNRNVIAKSLKNTDVSATGAVSGSVYEDFDTKLVTCSGKLDDVLVDTSNIQLETTAIKGKTDILSFTGSDVKATLDGETVTVSSVLDKTGYSISAADQTASATVFWNYGTRTLSSYGTLVSDVSGSVWSAGTRSLTDKLGFSLDSAYDSAKTASSQISVNNIQLDVTAIKAKTDKLSFDSSNYLYSHPLLGTVDATNAGTAVWSELLSGMIATGSIGKKLADWVLGFDNKVLLSSNAQTGVTIPTVTNVTNDVDISQDGADKVWNTVTRTITDGVVNSVTGEVSISQASADQVWASPSRTLTNYGSLVSDIRTSVWSAPTRTITDKTGFVLANTQYPTIASYVWLNAIRTLTSGTKDLEIDFIKAQTDKLTFDSTNNIFANTVTATVDAASVWNYSSRSLTDRTDFMLSSYYDSAKVAASQTSVNDLKVIMDKVDTMLELDGSVYKFTVKALEQAPVGGIMDVVIDGTVTFQQAMVKILSFSANDVVITGTDPKVAEFKNSDNTAVIMTHTMPLDGSGRTTI